LRNDARKDEQGQALAADVAGQVYAGGLFTATSDGGVTLGRAARWDGSDWIQVGDGFNNTVYTLVIDGAGGLYAGGSFTVSGETGNINRVARWDGNAWKALGGGLGNNNVYALGFDSAGQLYAAGNFTRPTNPTLTRIAKWDGVAWNPLGNGVNGNVYALAVLPENGSLFVGGSFSQAGKKISSYIATWLAAVGQPIPATGIYTFYTDFPVQIEVTQLGNLAEIEVQRVNTHHPNATLPLQTSFYWSIEGLDHEGNPASGFNVNLTIPTTFMLDNYDKVCWYTGSEWDCAAASFDENTITRTNVTHFSDWAAGDDTGPTAITVQSFSGKADGQAPLWVLLALVGIGMAGWWTGRRLGN